MKGFFSLEILLILYLLTYLFYISEPPPVPLLRETGAYAQDAAQVLLYGHGPEELPTGSFAIWVDGRQLGGCDYSFRYCTTRHYDGGEHRVCAAECLP